MNHAALRMWTAALVVETKHIPRMRLDGRRYVCRSMGAAATPIQLQRSVEPAAAFYAATTGARATDVAALELSEAGARWIWRPETAA